MKISHMFVIHTNIYMYINNYMKRSDFFFYPLTQNYLLSQIFSYIEKQKDLYNFTLVNSSWNYPASIYLYRSPKPKYVNKFTETLILSKQKKTSLPYNE